MCVFLFSFVTYSKSRSLPNFHNSISPKLKLPGGNSEVQQSQNNVSITAYSKHENEQFQYNLKEIWIRIIYDFCKDHSLQKLKNHLSWLLLIKNYAAE